MAGRHKKGPTLYIASMGIQTAFDVVRPKHIAKLMGDQEAHGWTTAALLRDMRGLEGHAAFERVEGKFKFTLTLAKQRRWAGVHVDKIPRREPSDLQPPEGRKRLDCATLNNAIGADDEGADRGGLTDGIWKPNRQV